MVGTQLPPQNSPRPVQSAPETGTATVVVACRLPHGIWIHGEREVERYENVVGGGSRPVKLYERTGEQFMIAGNARPALIDPNRDYAPLNAGAALTYGVPAALWEAWYAANRNSQMVREGLIYAAAKEDDVKAFTRETREVKSGLEPLDPSGDPRLPRGVGRGTTEAA